MAKNIGDQLKENGFAMASPKFVLALTGSIAQGTRSGDSGDLERTYILMLSEIIEMLRVAFRSVLSLRDACGSWPRRKLL